MTPITQEVTPASATSTRRSDAVGMEIPVVVHASRYSAASRGTAKALPSVHEETRTVIVFPQGAVVRLSATMVQGELVVLTNQQSGADVLCKVANVKAQPGIQNYVDLEFTQRAPGFWGDCFGSGAPRAEKTAVPEASATIAPPTAKEAPPAPVPVRMQQIKPPEPPVVMQPKPAPPPVVSVVPPSAVPATQDNVIEPPPVVPAVVAPPVPSAPVAASVAPAVRSAAIQYVNAESDAAPAAASKPDFGRGLGGSLLAATAMSSASRSVDLGSAEVSSRSNSKKLMFIGVAAVVVLGLTGGGFLLYRQGRSSAEAPIAPQATQQVSSPTAATSLPSSDGSMVTVSAEPVVVGAVVENPPAAQQAANAPKSANSPADGSRRSNMPVALSRPTFKGAAEANSSMEAPVLSAEANQPVLGTGLTAGRDGAPAPGSLPAAPSAEGGRIDPPKLTSSASAIYPAIARNSNIEGVVVVDALVDASGTVTQAQAISGPTLLRQAAADSVRSWKYQPAKLGGQPIAVHTQVSVDFHLNAAAAVTGSGAPANSIAATSSQSPIAAPSVAAVAPGAGPIQAPKLVASPPPVYPNNARSSSVEGVVVLDLLVDETGKVTQAKVVSGPPLLQPAAVEAVHSWKYQPARQGGQAIAQHTQVSINFRLR